MSIKLSIAELGGNKIITVAVSNEEAKRLKDFLSQKLDWKPCEKETMSLIAEKFDILRGERWREMTMTDIANICYDSPGRNELNSIRPALLELGIEVTKAKSGKHKKKWIAKMPSLKKF